MQQPLSSYFDLIKTVEEATGLLCYENERRWREGYDCLIFKNEVGELWITPQIKTYLFYVNEMQQLIRNSIESRDIESASFEDAISLLNTLTNLVNQMSQTAKILELILPDYHRAASEDERRKIIKKYEENL